MININNWTLLYAGKVKYENLYNKKSGSIIYGMEGNKINSKILIVDDEPQINRLIELVLLSEGFCNIEKAYGGYEALEKIKANKPDLILLDVMIPEIDGYSLCKMIKENNSLNSSKVIMLTAKKMEEDILKGFECGAADYISKPFSNKILVARIKAHLGGKSSTIQKYKDIMLDRTKKAVYIKGVQIELTKFEFEIFETFMSNIGMTFSRSNLLSYLRIDGGFDISERAVDFHIVNLRKKLGEFGSYIETVRGVGYRLKEEEN